MRQLLDNPLDEEIISEINLTPLVDVSLVLVIIFMIVAPLFSNILKPLILPAATNVGLNEMNAIKVSLFPDGTVAVGPTIARPEHLAETVQKEISGGRLPWVLIRAGTHVSHGRVMDAVKAVKIGGAQRIGFAVQSRGEE